ncbi:hypothetical protein AGABI1DRAFT_95176 [Agaricus bisporus var. burnettii JB137-S8]|uniref:Uncharacterized protein n=1 Tax=Agaricus bisporus var. burnettii (strain JB137-S8 / ATCC MYA-4627 / FGSC 10392) TaxID=597362 RepID=K5WWC6_AGABU|nr:uncharacterized protein AGABI1DRAFT_95176 [Agaricus bisporus var. burnettii JB137-S8]EKM75073.1 hypothetical protein AGABI1DRAFT_95176 [Agaricus bisporus var. burnettii JB137-S8]
MPGDGSHLLYFSNRTIHVGDLIVNNAEFRALIERRRALSPKPRPSQKRESATLAPPMGSRPVVKAFILWTEAGKSPTLISFFCESTKPIRLVDYRKTLEENGVRYGRAVEVFDTSQKAWVYLGWSAEYFCGERQDVLLRYYGLDKIPKRSDFRWLEPDFHDECLATRLDIDTPTKTSQYTTVTAWVKQVAIPYFHKTRETTPAEDKTWYKNQCSKHNVSVRRKPVDPEHTEEPDACRTGSTSDKLPSVRQFVIQEYKAEISQLAKEPDGTQPTNYMRRWNQAVTRRVEMLSPNEREVLQAKVDEEMARRARPPTRAEVLASQDKLCAEASEAVHGLLGWGRKQHGDAICFMTMVYRDYSNEIQERTFFISNENDSIAHCKPFKERYDNLMSGHLAAYADSALPKHDVFACESDDISCSSSPYISSSHPPAHSPGLPAASLPSLPEPRPATPPQISPGPSGLPLPSSPGIATQPAVLRTAETRKPRQKRGNLPQQAIRTSTRSTRPPKRAGPLTENNQAPRTKVPVKQRWAYVSEEENQNSPQPPQKNWAPTGNIPCSFLFTHLINHDFCYHDYVPRDNHDYMPRDNHDYMPRDNHDYMPRDNHDYVPHDNHDLFSHGIMLSTAIMKDSTRDNRD